MNHVTIRKVNTDDALEVSGLSAQLGYPTSVGTLRERLTEAAHDAGREIVVAESGGRIVGWIEVAIGAALESGRWVEIRGLVVDEQHRGHRVGTALVEWAKAWADERGFARLRVRTNEKRSDAHRFYVQCGFEHVKSQRVYDASVRRSAPSGAPSKT